MAKTAKHDFRVGDIVIPLLGRWEGKEVRIVEIVKQFSSSDLIHCVGKYSDIGRTVEKDETGLAFFPHEIVK